MFPASAPPVSSGPSNPMTDVNRVLQILKTPDPTIVFVHATWCGHCSSMYPFWNTLCKSRRETNGLISIESEVVKQLEAAGDVPAGWRIEGFPTIWVISGWRVVDTFNGGGDMLASWANDKLGAVPEIPNISAPRMKPRINYSRRRRTRGRRRKTRSRRRKTRHRKTKSGRRRKTRSRNGRNGKLN